MTNPPRHTDLTEIEGEPGPRAYVPLNEVEAQVQWPGGSFRLIAKMARQSLFEVAIAFILVEVFVGFGGAVVLKIVLGLSGLMSAMPIPAVAVVYVTIYALVRTYKPNGDPSRRAGRRRRRS